MLGLAGVPDQAFFFCIAFYNAICGSIGVLDQRPTPQQPL